MKLLKIDDHIINPEQICYFTTWGYQTVDVFFAGRKKPLELDKDKFLAALRKEALLEHERTKPQERPKILPIDTGRPFEKPPKFPNLSRVHPDGVQLSLDFMAGEESE